MGVEAGERRSRRRYAASLEPADPDSLVEPGPAAFGELAC